MKTLRVALAQINSTVGDLAGNTGKIISFLNKAKGRGADLVTFPELSICGYPPEDLLFKPHFIKDNLKFLKKIVNSSRGISAVIGFVDKDKEAIYNAAAIINNNKIQGIYHKMILPNYSVFDEKRYFHAGGRFLVFELGGVTFGVNICEDIWEEKGPTELQVKEGNARVIINISASPYHAGKRKLREEILRKRAKEFKVFILYNNLVGGQDELVFDGGGMVLNCQGKIIAQGREFEEDLILFDLRIEEKPVCQRGKIVKLISLSFIEKKKKRLPLARRKKRELGKIEEIYQALVLGTKDYVKKNGFEKVVFGLSGGIDSSLTALIATDALGRENVICLSMPSCYSLSAPQKDVRRIARNLRIKLITVPIDEIFISYLRVFRRKFKGKKEDVTEENIQARIRGNILMAFSNKFGWLVLATGNKSEVGVGYCTLYGDMAGGFNVLKDVPKTLVYKLARYKNRKAKGKLIPSSVFKRAPSAELRPNQRDEDSLPPYSVLDPILTAYVEEDKSPSEIEAGGFERKVIKKVIGMVDSNEYKRRQGPPGIKITPRAFGKDRRLPITNRYRDF